jgi:hypothetical protein
VERFEQVTGVPVDNLEVVFRNFTECSGGACTMAYCQKSVETKYSDLGFKKTEIEHNLIVVNTTYFNPAIPASTAAIAADREELMFHEMGHCVLGRPHVDESLWQSSIMVPYHFSSAYYLNNYGGYISELVHPGNGGFSGQYAGYSPNDGTYASKVFPEFVDRGDEIKVLSQAELQGEDFHEEHIDTVEHDQPTETQNSQN